MSLKKFDLLLGIGPPLENLRGAPCLIALDDVSFVTANGAPAGCVNVWMKGDNRPVTLIGKLDDFDWLPQEDDKEQ